MPRPKRDWNVALREDLEKLDQRIESLLIERERKRRMLDALNSSVEVDVRTLIDQRATTRPAKKARR